MRTGRALFASCAGVLLLGAAMVSGCAGEPSPDEYRDVGVAFKEPAPVLMMALRDVLVSDMSYELDTVDEDRHSVSTHWKERAMDKDGRMRMGAAGVRTKIWARIAESLGKRFVLVAALREVNTSPHGDDIAAWGESSFDDGEFSRVQARLRSRLGRFIGDITPSDRLGKFMERTGQLSSTDRGEIKPLDELRAADAEESQTPKPPEALRPPRDR